jgi:aminoglycoside phosphotransferase (APT) family kinase protein
VEQELAAFLRHHFDDADDIVIEDLVPIAGGFSRETYRFDARVRWTHREEVVPLILRKDPPPAAALLQSNRAVEHALIEAVRAHTGVPVSRSYGYVMDPEVFGEPAMVLGRMHGNPNTSDLFNEGPDAHHADDVVRHLCEVLVELHQADISRLDPHGHLADPRGVGIDASSWERYMETTLDYYVRSWDDICYDPAQVFLLDLFLTLRREVPRPLHLALVHGDFNPANFLYQEGRVTALFDWENSRIGDPREDLGWMVTMDVLSNTSVMAHPKDEGGFLAYYNKLTGLNITQEEVDYFTMFGTANIAVPVTAAVRRRMVGEHQQFLHLYLAQSALPAGPSLAAMMNYPGVS